MRCTALYRHVMSRVWTPLWPVVSLFVLIFFFSFFSSHKVRAAYGETPAAVKTVESELRTAARTYTRRRAGKAPRPVSPLRAEAEALLISSVVARAHARDLTGGGRELDYWLTVPANRRWTRVKQQNIYCGKQKTKKREPKRWKRKNSCVSVFRRARYFLPDGSCTDLRLYNCL